MVGKSRGESDDRRDKKITSNATLGSFPLDGPSVSEGTMLAETDAEYTETNRDLVAQLLRLLQDQDREIVDLLLDELKPKEIAEKIPSTSEAVQKKWERIRKWLFPIARNLETLINRLPEKKDRWIMERYLDGQPISEITEALGISHSTVEKTVKRVIADWKKAAKNNPTDPVSAMAKKER